jgi:hypothetical protein
MRSPSVILRSVVFQGRKFEVGRVYRYFYESYSVHLVFLVLNIKVADTRNFTGYNLQTLTLYDMLTLFCTSLVAKCTFIRTIISKFNVN